MRSNQEVRKAVEDLVETWIQYTDSEQQLAYEQYDAILAQVADELFDRLLDAARPELNDDDRAFVQSKVEPLVQSYLEQPVKSRFEKFDRVVCKIGGEQGWAPGTIQALDESDPSDPTGKTVLPYVVKIDPPIGRLISVPYDENPVCRAEICFGQWPEGDLFGLNLGFSLRCRPKRKLATRRFGLGDRVACAVEDSTGDYTVWAPGVITDVDYNVEDDARAVQLNWDWTRGGGVMPYRVLLDSGAYIFVHHDVHWLVRDLNLQPAGPRQSADGTRDLKRLVKRRHSPTEWALIDHSTRKVRIEAAGGAEDEDSDDEPVSMSVS